MFEAVSINIYVTDRLPDVSSGPSRQKSGSEDPQPDRAKVLIVDDQSLIADTLCEILEMAGYHAMPAYDGWTALEIAARFHPDYLLSDVLMPHMNGVELAITVRKTYPTVKILLFSGQAGISDLLREGEKQGYEFELIAKPIHPTNLIERLKEFK